MSDLAIIKTETLGTDEMQQLRDELKPHADENDMSILITNAEIEGMDERELKEMLGMMVGKLDYHLNE